MSKEKETFMSKFKRNLGLFLGKITFKLRVPERYCDSYIYTLRLVREDVPGAYAYSDIVNTFERYSEFLSDVYSYICNKKDDETLLNLTNQLASMIDDFYNVYNQINIEIEGMVYLYSGVKHIPVGFGLDFNEYNKVCAVMSLYAYLESAVKLNHEIASSFSEHGVLGGTLCLLDNIEYMKETSLMCANYLKNVGKAEERCDVGKLNREAIEMIKEVKDRLEN